MARRAWRITYNKEVGTSQQSVYYGSSEVEANEYGAKLFKNERDGYITVSELAEGDTGVPSDEQLREWAQQMEAAASPPEWMRNVHGDKTLSG